MSEPAKRGNSGNDLSVVSSEQTAANDFAGGETHPLRRSSQTRASIREYLRSGEAPTVAQIDEQQLKTRGFLNRKLVKEVTAANRAYEKAFWSAKSERFGTRAELLKHLNHEVKLRNRTHAEIALNAGITESMLADLIGVGAVVAISSSSAINADAADADASCPLVDEPP